jgi:dTDP-4-amino-4,6-dideoxygalactose transaminase
MKNVRKVDFFDYKRLFTDHSEDILNVISKVSSRGAFIMQQDLKDFELKLAEYTGARYAVGVANATDALQMLLMTLKLEKGDEVIFCSHTMVATASAIHFAGGVPIPAAAAGDHLIDVASIEKVITSKTRAIVPTQLNGRTADMDAILRLAKDHDLAIVEDSAQALGSKYKGRCAGTFDVGGCISFYPAKTLGCFGDGGAVLCNDKAIYEEILLLRDHGRNQSGSVECWGLNSRLDNIQAAILSYSFERYDEEVLRRRKIASMYNDALSSIKQIKLPPAPNASIDHFDIFQNYELEVENLDGLEEYLKNNGIGTLRQWGGKGVHQFPKLGLDATLPDMDELFKRMIMLPINQFLNDDDVDYVITKIQEFYGNMS